IALAQCGRYERGSGCGPGHGSHEHPRSRGDEHSDRGAVKPAGHDYRAQYHWQAPGHGDHRRLAVRRSCSRSAAAGSAANPAGAVLKPMANPTKAFLGVGWSFPVKPVGGRLRLAAYEDDVEQAIQIILLTDRGERPMLPEFGGGLRSYLFEPNSPATRRNIE